MENISTTAQSIWEIANTLRGKMGAEDYRSYILGFIFYRYLSKHQVEYFANNNVFKINEGQTIIQAYQEAVETDGLDPYIEDITTMLGYAIKPEHLWEVIVEKIHKGNIKVSDFKEIFDSFTANAERNKEAAKDFKRIFEDVNLSNIRLGEDITDRAKTLSRVVLMVDDMNFKDDQGRDILGEIYEELIGKFAANAGKKGGEFYTPHSVSKILSRIVTLGVPENTDVSTSKHFSVYDPTCGSGSLLLTVAEALPNGKKKGRIRYYGQEKNTTTYNLARMNLLMHGVSFENMYLSNRDTLEEDWPNGINAEGKDDPLFFDAVIANPPYSAKWEANPIKLRDKRFNKYGKLAPATKADYAFVLHCLYHLNEKGTTAIVLPHGVLFRGSAEYTIRKKLIDDNHVHAVIGLPANVFFGTSIPTCILVLKQKRTIKDILFIDASNEFVKGKNQNYLSEQHINKIIEIYSDRKNIDKFAHIATLDEIVANDYNLNISRYVDTFIKEEEIDSTAVLKQLTIYDKDIEKLKNEFNLQRSMIQPVQIKITNSKHIKLRFAQYKDDLQLVKLKDLIKYKNGKGYEKYVVSSGNLELITINSIAADGKLQCSGKFVNEVTETLNKNDLVMSLSGYILGLGRVAVIPEDKKFVLNQRVARLRPNENSDAYFLSYLINNHQEYFQLHGTGTAQLNLSKESVEEFTCYIPKLEEQQKIGQFFNIIDQIINTQQFKIINTKTLKQSLLQKMFPKRGSLIPEIRYSEFTEDWKLKKLSEVCKVTMGQSPSGETYSKEPSDYILVQGNADLKDGYVFPRIWTTQKTKTADAGDLIISVRAPVGSVGKTMYDVVIGRGVAAVKGNEFIYQTLVKMDFENYWTKVSEGTTFESINSLYLKNAEFLAPDNILEQTKIGNFLNSLDRLVQVQQRKLDSLKLLKKAYLQKMFV